MKLKQKQPDFWATLASFWSPVRETWPEITTKSSHQLIKYQINTFQLLFFSRAFPIRYGVTGMQDHIPEEHKTSSYVMIWIKKNNSECWKISAVAAEDNAAHISASYLSYLRFSLTALSLPPKQDQLPILTFSSLHRPGYSRFILAFRMCEKKPPWQLTTESNVCIWNSVWYLLL